MNPKYNTKIRATETFKNSTQKTLQISKTSGDMITVDDVIELGSGLQKVGEVKGFHTQLLIKGMSKAWETTLKGFDEDLKSIDDYLEYYSNKVKSTDKFNGFFQLQITIVTYKIDDKNQRVPDRKARGHSTVKAIKEPAVEKIVDKNLFKKKSKK